MSIGWGLAACLVLLAVGLAIPRWGPGIATAASIGNVLLGQFYLLVLSGTVRRLGSPEHTEGLPDIVVLLLLLALNAATGGVIRLRVGSRSRLALLFACAAPVIGLVFIAYVAVTWPQLGQPPWNPGARTTGDVEFLAWLLLPAILTLREYSRNRIRLSRG